MQKKKKKKKAKCGSIDNSSMAKKLNSRRLICIKDLNEVFAKLPGPSTGRELNFAITRGKTNGNFLRTVREEKSRTPP